MLFNDQDLRGVRNWWVNHNQTHREEIEGGYLWSPKKNKNGTRNETYLNLARVSPGDTVFSYAGKKLRAVGVATAEYRESVRPPAFGSTGEQWDRDGWLVPVTWSPLREPLSPKAHIEVIAPLLPKSHSPIRPDGDGNQFCYLAAIDDALGYELLRLLQQDNTGLRDSLEDLRLEVLEEVEEDRLEASDLPVTEKEQVVKARRGQGLFRLRVEAVEAGCRLSGTTDRRLLVASHIKPWRVCDNAERLDGHNGLLLAPHVDRLFDRGFISFTDEGHVLCRNVTVGNQMRAWGLDHDANVGSFSEQQRVYLRYHRQEVWSRS